MYFTSAQTSFVLSTVSTELLVANTVFIRRVLRVVKKGSRIIA